jgi:glycosyltransferase involved in cell wall biosynthesis
LVVARWPLGGIRTYIKYVYRYLPKEKYNIKLIAPETAEIETLEKDIEDLGLSYVKVDLRRGLASYFYEIFRTLKKGHFSLIQSHGFISGACALVPALLFGIPHVLTIHSILEEILLGKGLSFCIRLFFLKFMISKTILYAVSKDILDHVTQKLKIDRKETWRVIHNGIDLELFKIENCIDKDDARDLLGLPKSKVIVGFVGRFMPQKGFNYLIDAVDLLRVEKKLNNLVVAAVGSGDYLKHYQQEINERSLEKYFIFIPFQTDMKSVYQAIDILVMPSIWEAFPLQPAESMVMGVPIIVSDCIGLKECVKGTPAIVVPMKDPRALANAIFNLDIKEIKKEFIAFIPLAKDKFDVRKTVRHVQELFERACISS